MNKKSTSRRCVSFTLSAALLLSSWGPAASSALARQVAGKVSPVSVVPQLGLLARGIGAPSPSAASLSLPPPLAVPVVSAPALAVTPVPSALEAVKPSAPGETFGRAAAEDFSRRMTGENLASGNGELAESVVVDAVSPALRTNLSAPSRMERINGAPVIKGFAAPTKPEGEKREAFFPLWLAGFSGLAWGAAEFARWGAHAFGADAASPSMGGMVLAGAAIAAMALTGAFVLNAVIDAAVFVVAMRRGRGITDAQLRAVLLEMVLDERYGLNGNAAALVRPYRPDNKYKDFTFAFASRGLIWVRPELAAWPWLLRLILRHELTHMTAGSPRGPPRGAIRGLRAHIASEARARAAEFKGEGALKQIKVSGLQRALVQTHMSLRFSSPYDMLVLTPETKKLDDAHELEDEKLYDALSDGAARVTALKSDEPEKILSRSENRGRFRAIVLGGAALALPDRSSKEHLRLRAVLKQLDSLYVLATRRVVRGDAFKGTTEIGAWKDLVDRAQRLRENGGPRALQAFEGELGKLWRQIASQRLKGVGVSVLIDGLYGSLRDRGFAFLSFAPDDHGVVSWEKLLRYWEAADGGQFRVTRVDLEDGGHQLILRKIEARVGLWLRPISGGHITTSVPNASFTEEGRAAARKALEDAGFDQQLGPFEKLGVSVRHVFGADVGRQEIYVTVPRRNKSAIVQYVSVNAKVLDSQSFETHLMDSAGLQGVKPVWSMGNTGAGGWWYGIDTGAEAPNEDFGGRLDIVDIVDEGPEDWGGHGTHVSGIAISGNETFPGMAKGAKGTMAKVFSRDQAGASDGDIMAAAVVAMKKISAPGAGLMARIRGVLRQGVDVISLSLGSRGTAGDNLAEFFSQLTHQKNSVGESPIVAASGGNSGPFDRTLSQPSVGVDVIAVAAAAKSKDDGIPEIAFYSSVGPDIDGRFAIKRFRLKPEITGIGGDVVTTLGSLIVYLFGVFSTRSKDAPRAPSDLEDGKHTGMSGTSMSNPAVAAIALLVKLAMRLVGVPPFVVDNMAFAVKAVLMRTATDMGVPVWFSVAGLVNAAAAVALVRESAAAPDGWAWLERLKAVQDAEDRVYRGSELAKSEAQTPQEEGEHEEASEEPANRSAAGNIVRIEVQKRFDEARDAELSVMLAALKDPVWLVRMRAAAVLMNFKSPASAAALVEVGLNDPDARVRRMAFLALAELPTLSAPVNTQLRKAASSGAWDVGVYAAYVLARRGDLTAVARIVNELGNADKRARFTSTWLLGQLGSSATAVEAQGLSARVRDRGERGNIRHLAAAALSNLADAAPEALSDRVVMDLLDASGVENLALLSTIVKVFPIAVQSKAFVLRLRSEPLKPVITAFVLKNRDALSKPGALNRLVQLLAQAADVPLDAPIAPMDSSGLGVSGVDEAMGPVDVFVSAPYGAEEDEIDAATLSRFETTTRAALPVSQGLWLSVPEHKLRALTIALEYRDWTVRRSPPLYPLSDVPAEPGGLTIDMGDGEKGTEFSADADFSFVRVSAASGVSEVRVMAALERVAAAAKDKGPVLIALTLAAPKTDGAPLAALIDRLVASGIGVVVGAGNAGPKNGSVAAPGDSGLAVVVAAASRAGLQFYSSRGTLEAPRVSWTDLVDDLNPGTAAAAERTAAKLAGLARVLSAGMTAAGRSLPDGWFLYLTALVKRSVTTMPSYGEHEVGAGLFDSADRALEALRAGLLDPEALAREAKILADAARDIVRR